MAVAHPFGVALSGGGFRAAAFHLGVLKRLRELGLLEQIDFLSTVSGGSIVGAYWVYWQALKDDTIHNPDEWNSFERAMINLMRGGLRERIAWVGLGLPTLALGLVVAILVRFSWPVSIGVLIGLLIGVALVGYVVWHFLATVLLQWQYHEKLFGKSTVAELRQAPGTRWRPRLVINAAALNAGEPLIFAPFSVGGVWWLLFSKVAALLKTTRRARPFVEMPEDTPLARAVAASSAIPLVFTPVPMQSALTRIGRLWGRVLSGLLRSKEAAGVGTYWAVDGGVFDNQGTQVLLDQSCRGILVSDAAAALTTDPVPSTWQFVPPGKGVVWRSQDIIYERARDLGYRRLADRHDLSRLIDRAVALGLPQAVADQLVKEFAPVVEGYAYVELRPSENFLWTEGGLWLPQALVPYVAAIRTDLDRFSTTEISALMYHGYTLIDHCLRAYRPGWINDLPMRFRSPVPGIAISWARLTPAQVARAARHLDGSSSRVFVVRCFRRLKNKLVPDAEWVRTEGPRRVRPVV